VSNEITVTKDGDLFCATAEGFPDLVEWAKTKEEAIELIEDSVDTLREMLDEGKGDYDG
jgi:hypothetical protein